MERISTGIESLDQILNGGIPSGSTILLAGMPGAGKTILASQMVYSNASRDKKALYLTTLSEPQAKVLKFQQNFEFFKVDMFQRSVIYHDLASKLRSEGISHVPQILDDLLKAHAPNILVLDTFKLLAELVPSVVKLREFLLDLNLRTAAWNCTTLLLGEYNEDELHGQPETAICDGIIYLSGMENRKHQKRHLRILKMRGTAFVAGENSFLISNRGIELFPRLRSSVCSGEVMRSREKISTGIQGLDVMLHGGVLKGTTTLLAGSSGTGKTVMALQFAAAGVSAGERVLYVSFEEQPNMVISNALSINLDFRTALSEGQLLIIHVSPLETDVDEYSLHVLNLVSELDIDRVVIDSITSFEVGMIDKIKYSDHVWGLAAYLKAQGKTVFFTYETTDASTSGLTRQKISFVMDNILALRFVEQGTALTRRVRVVKTRGCAHDENDRPFCIGQGGVTVMGDKDHGI